MFDIRQVILSRFSEKNLAIAIARRKRECICSPWYNNPVEHIIDDVRRRELADLFRKKFDEATRSIQYRLHGETPEDKIVLLKSFRKIVSMDLAYSKISNLVYYTEKQNTGCVFPDAYHDENGDSKEIAEEDVPISVEGKYVIECPYDTRKWLYHLKRSENLNADKYTESHPIYYPELDIVLQGNGCIHRTAEAFVNERTGTAMVKMRKIEPLFSHVITDGANWISVHRGNSIREVGDYRLALLYWLKQQERTQEKENNKS